MQNPCPPPESKENTKEWVEEFEMIMTQTPKGTVRGESKFSARGTAKEMESAFRGNGTDERLIIDILSTLDNDQRQELADEYAHRYDEVRKSN